MGVVICNNCKCFHWETTNRCGECFGSTFSPTSESNRDRIRWVLMKEVVDELKKEHERLNISIESAVINQIVEDNENQEYEAYSEMFNRLFKIEGVPQILWEYLSDERRLEIEESLNTKI